jgi:hypothetical protein
LQLESLKKRKKKKKKEKKEMKRKEKERRGEFQPSNSRRRYSTICI